MDYAEFTKLHEECATARKDYFVEAEKTSLMLAECTPEPLAFNVRLALAVQGILENHAHSTYLGIRGLLLDAARLGFGSSN